MIFAKIYLDRDETGELLVFEASPDDQIDRLDISLAGKRFDFFGRFYMTETRTRINDIRAVAISPEAREAFKKRLNDRTLCTLTDGEKGDFGMAEVSKTDRSYSTGYFYFQVDTVDLPTKRILRENDKFSVESYYNNCHINALDEMTEGDNELLKAIDVTKPFDEAILAEARIRVDKIQGKEPAVDVETIRKTPFSCLTAAQKKLIRDDFRSRCLKIGAQEWHDHPEMYTEMITLAVGEVYNKAYGAISAIVNEETP